MTAINTPSRRGFQAITALLLALLCLLAQPLRAHELTPTIADLTLAPDGAVTLELRANLEAMIAGIGPEHDDTAAAPQAADYERLRALSPAELAARFGPAEDALLADLVLTAEDRAVRLTRHALEAPEVGDTSLPRLSRLAYTGTWPAGAAEIGWQYPARHGDIVLRVRMAGTAAPLYAELLPAGTAETIGLGDGQRPGFWQTLARYVDLGFDHILPKGLDHVLFIIGLFLLSARLRPLLVQVTTFTLAHSVTLALGLLGWINIPGSIVEPLIALSIVFVAVENIFTQTLHRWRTAIVFGFGLLHGLGFAGVLSELTVSSGQFAASLIGFNLGVELGQVAVVVLCYAAVGYWFGAKPWYHARIVVPASALIALIAGYWVIERIGLLA